MSHTFGDHTRHALQSKCVEHVMKHLQLLSTLSKLKGRKHNERMYSNAADCRRSVSTLILMIDYVVVLC